MECIPDTVRKSTALCLEILGDSSPVKINESMVQILSSEMASSWPPEWNDDSLHLTSNEASDEDLVQYLFVVDCLNFCFWPSDHLQYIHLAKGVSDAWMKQPRLLEAVNLVEADETTVRSFFSYNGDIPLLKERIEMLREAGRVLIDNFNGKAINMVEKASSSASSLVEMIVNNFEGFRDKVLFKGMNVSFFKRAQIFVADVWGAFKGKGIGYFSDIDKITMFADYRVPQFLRHKGVLSYCEEFSHKVDTECEIESGSVEEVAIRAATIQTVEKIIKILSNIPLLNVTSVEIDWYLWQQGEKIITEMKPHHKCRTRFY